MNLSKLLYIYVSVILLACNGQSKNKNSEPTVPVGKKNLVYPYSAMDEELNSYPQIKTILGNNPCIKEDNCDTIEISAGVAPLKNEQILILENINLIESSFHRYKDRISGFYLENGFGIYRRMFPKAVVSKPFLEMVNVINNEHGQISKRIPSLGYYLYQHNQVKVIKDGFNRITHSDRVVEFAIDRNPDVNFILADNPLINNDIACGAFDDEQSAFKQFGDKLNSALFDLTDIIKKNRVKFVNMSFLSTPQSIDNYLRGACGHGDWELAKKIVHYYNLFYQKLLEMNPNIILVQAVPNDDYSEYECPFDQRWLRVGYTNRVDSSIPSEGEELTREGIAKNLDPVFSCISMAVNSGIIDKTDDESHMPLDFDNNSLFYNYHGLFAYPVDIMATSWATPIALSYLRALSKGKPADQIYKTAINRIFDPVKNKQFISNQ